LKASPFSGFGGATAKQLVDAGRATEVEDFIATVDSGARLEDVTSSFARQAPSSPTGSAQGKTPACFS
jgi:hypothetical protein